MYVMHKNSIFLEFICLIMITFIIIYPDMISFAESSDVQINNSKIGINNKTNLNGFSETQSPKKPQAFSAGS